MAPSSHFVVSAPFHEVLADLTKDLQSPLCLFFLVSLGKRARVSLEKSKLVK